MNTESVAIEKEADGALAMVIDEKAPVSSSHHGGAGLSRFRLACLLVVAVYPLITALLYIVMPLTDGWDIWHRTFIITPVMVFSIVFLVSPAINRHFGWFVARLPRPVRQEG